MLKKVGAFAVALCCVLLAVELETEGQGKGAEKKAEAQKRIEALADPLLPEFADPIVHQAAGMLIDGLVAFANRTGFFARFAAA